MTKMLRDFIGVVSGYLHWTDDARCDAIEAFLLAVDPHSIVLSHGMAMDLLQESYGSNHPRGDRA